MQEPKTRPTEASVPQFIGAIPDATRRDECAAIVAMMEEVTGAPQVMWGSSIVGFGSYRQRYASGKELEWPILGFSPRKQHLVLYVMPGFERYADLMDGLGKYKTGKSCLYIRKLGDVNGQRLRALLERSVSDMRTTRVR